MSDSMCSRVLSATGDGCHYCQPQEYIDRLEDLLEEDREEITRMESEVEAKDQALHLIKHQS